MVSLRGVDGSATFVGAPAVTVIAFACSTASHRPGRVYYNETVASADCSTTLQHTMLAVPAPGVKRDDL
jgi:hypothetical protein